MYFTKIVFFATCSIFLATYCIAAVDSDDFDRQFMHFGKREIQDMNRQFMSFGKRELDPFNRHFLNFGKRDDGVS